MTAGVCSALFMLLPCSHPTFYMGYLIIITASQKVFFAFSVFETCMGALQRILNLGPTAPFACSGFVASKWLGQAKVGGGGRVLRVGGGVTYFGGVAPVGGRGGDSP